MGIVSFDRKPSGKTKKVVSRLFTSVYLFDGYLIEPASYQHSDPMAYLTGSSLHGIKTIINVLFSSTYLFDGYLTDYSSYFKYQLGKLRNLFVEKAEKIIK
jgi:hypothetical protein